MSEKTETKPLFERLSAINVNEFTEKKGGLTYLSWAHAWKLFKQHAPDATYKILKSDTGSVAFRCGTGLTVYTEVTAEGETHEMWLPVLNHSNKSIVATDANSFEINKTVMRCLVKNLAMFGLGIYIYAGEDLPEDPKPEAPKPPVDRNAGCKSWREWKGVSGSTLGSLVDGDKAKEQKLKILNDLKATYEKAVNDSKTNEEQALLERDFAFITDSIDNV